jgi:hypothetical protein
MKITGNLSFSLIMIARSRAVAMLLHKSASDPGLTVPHWVAKHPELKMTREEACAEIDKMPVERRRMLEREFFRGFTKTVLAVVTKSSVETNETVASTAVSKLAGAGLEVIDLESDAAFARRQLHVAMPSCTSRG